VDLLTAHRNILRGADADAHLAAPDADNGDRDLFAELDGLADPTCR
jgi:hypothetical protein